MKVYGDVMVQLDASFISALDGGTRSASCRGRFNPQYPSSRRIYGPQSRSRKREEERNILFLPLIEPFQPSRYTDSAIQAPKLKAEW
jgi:hypothetical protein